MNINQYQSPGILSKPILVNSSVNNVDIGACTILFKKNSNMSNVTYDLTYYDYPGGTV